MCADPRWQMIHIGICPSRTALRRGATPEVVEGGVAGFVCDAVCGLARRWADRRDRPRCEAPARAEANYSERAAVTGYPGPHKEPSRSEL
jgi:hypothetical protein